MQGRRIVSFSEKAGKGVRGWAESLHGVWEASKVIDEKGTVEAGSQRSSVVGQDGGIRRPLGDVKEGEKWLSRGEEGDSDGEGACAMGWEKESTG